MADIMTTWQYRVDLDQGPLEVELPSPLMHQDAHADAFAVTLRRGMEPADLTGAEVYGYLWLRSTNQTIPLTGETDGSTATIRLLPECYLIPGAFSLAMQLRLGETRHTLLKVQGIIARTSTDDLASLGDVPTLAELLAQIDDMTTATADAQVAAAAATDAAEGIQEQVDTALVTKVDSAYVEDGYLYLTAGGNIVAGPLGPFSGTGGGGSTSNNATLTLRNTSGFLAKTLASGAECVLQAAWSSLEDELPTGSGVLAISVGGSVKVQKEVEQGDVSIDVGPYLAAGANAVRLSITDVYGNSRSISYTLKVVAVSIASSFDPTVIQTAEIPFPYTPTGAVEKTVHFEVDGVSAGTAVVTSSGREQSFTFPAQSHGTHVLRVWFTAVVEGETVTSNVLQYSVICVESGNQTPIIAVDFRLESAEQFDLVAVPYTVYDPASLTAAVELSSNETVDVTALTVDRTQQVWSYRPELAGELVLTISCTGAAGLSTSASVTLEITETTLDVEAETSGLSLHLTSSGRSNAEADPALWQSGDIVAQLEGFNFVSDGWVQDEDGVTVLRVTGDARVNIPAQLFATDFRTTGKTIEVEFASREVLDYDAEILRCWSGERGLVITAQQMRMASEQSAVGSQYKEDEHLRLSIVIEKRSSTRLILIYVNGIVSGMLQYPTDDDFSQGAPVGISIGSSLCTTDIYNIRVYDTDLTRFQVLDNWIADAQILSERKDRYDRNNIFSEYGAILPDTLRNDQRYLIIRCPVLPQSKGDKKTCSGAYVDKVHPERSFTFENAQIDVQGTSSQYYFVKNYKIKFKGGFILTDGTNVEVYALNDDAVPVSEFTYKADVASSEGANNVELARLYNELCPVKTPAQQADPRVRQTIDGHPIVVFHDAGDGPYFLGKYNFNNDKGTAETFGFQTGDESWEIRENGNELVGFRTDDFTGWETSFEARYPEDYTDITRLQAFVSWVNSTDPDQATGDALAAAVTYGDVEYTTDSAEYRLAKFRAELPDHCDVDGAVFYYLFTLVFLCMDQREKNAFPTWINAMQRWIWLFYDADSSIGTDNQGDLSLEYWMEDIDLTAAGEPVFNGQANVFWSNLRKTYSAEIKAEYQRLRTDLREDGRPLLSYEVVNQMFEDHQSQWPEAIFNEDAWRKAVEPLKQGDAMYLPMQRGKKEHHFKWWMYNRFRYMDGKFETGDSMQDRVLIRAHAQADVSLVSYVNMYGRVYYNDFLAENRMVRGQEYAFPWAVAGAEDAVIGINDAALLTSIGDLAPLMAEEVNIAGCTHLTGLKVGDSAESYSNANLTSLTLGNNRLLRTLDVRNCPALTQAIDASGCANIEEVYFDGTAITGLSLPNGGQIKVLHLPGTITNLTVLNQKKLTDFALPSYSQITTLRVENSPAIPTADILAAIPDNSRVRLIGLDWTMDDADAVLSLYDRLDLMRGLDEGGVTVDTAQVSGVLHIDSLTGAQLAEMQERYPYITIDYAHITSNLYYWDDTGTTLLATEVISDGGDGAYTGTTPTKASTAQYTYAFSGWSKTVGGAASSSALLAVTADRNVYAAFTSTVRTYTVKWYNGSTLLETDTGVPYGTVPTYNGDTPVDATNGMPWKGWSPAVAAITGDTTYTATFESPKEVAEITDDWATIIASIDDGTYRSRYKVGNYKPLDLGSEGVINMQIAAFDADTLADGSGTAPITWIGVELLTTTHKWGTTLVTNSDGTYQEGTGTIGGWEKSALRTYMQETVKPLIPEAVSSRIRAVSKEQPAFDTSNKRFIQTSEDEVWVPNYSEINGSSAPYYNLFEDSTDNYKKCIVGMTTATAWWIRNAGTRDDAFYMNGTFGSMSITNARGVCLCFCLG